MNVTEWPSGLDPWLEVTQWYIRCLYGCSVLDGRAARWMGFWEDWEGVQGETLGLEWRNMCKRLVKSWLLRQDLDSSPVLRTLLSIERAYSFIPFGHLGRKQKARWQRIFIRGSEKNPSGFLPLQSCLSSFYEYWKGESSCNKAEILGMHTSAWPYSQMNFSFMWLCWMIVNSFTF